MALRPTSARRLEDIEADLLLLVLRERYGYDFTGYARASLLRRLHQLLELFATNSLADLIPTLLRDEQVAQTVVNHISVPVSAFFRDPSVWKYLRNELIPELESFPRINIWQVGCGHGQETWSLAILLHECGLAHKTRMVTTDINPDLIATARRGRWPETLFNEWRSNYLTAGGTSNFDHYFCRIGNEIEIQSDQLQSIEFVEHNLVSDDVFLETQLLICRNVLIYFGEALQARALDVFNRSLERGGFLLLGSAEAINKENSLWESVQPELRIFRKKMPEAICMPWS